ncbi:hypothetical protein [Salinisphaera sp. Q1T1-3]|uniref:hypothetical protein n=1 Tax=Salinisphaera sp. Q1T1-3 TaxID=2321229 RepID=UPI0011C40AE9|nr:hypothetical protein [Salinisphaera sp. Q1T1-3]
MATHTSEEIRDARNHVIKVMEEDVRKVLNERKEQGLSSTSFLASESFCETGAVYVEFNDFSSEFSKLILARIGVDLSLKLFTGSIRETEKLALVKSYGEYSLDSVREAVNDYFLKVRKIIEAGK